MDKDELIQQLMDALEKSSEAQDKYAEALDKLDEENKLLSDTIVKNNLGKINEERRKLLQKVKDTDKSAHALMDKAETIKSEYEQKLDKITILIKDVKSKQTDIDAYIDSESNAKIQAQKDKLNSNYKKQKQKLRDEFIQKESELNILADKYRKRQYIGIAVGVIGVVVSVIGFMF